MTDTNCTNRNAHTVFTASRARLLAKLAIGCLMLAVILTISTTQAREAPVGQPVVVNESPKVEPPAGELTDKLSELGGDDDEMPVADRPGKPDGHNSNGDDVVIRPPR